jgi:hypothetical protein
VTFLENNIRTKQQQHKNEIKCACAIRNTIENSRKNFKTSNIIMIFVANLSLAHRGAFVPVSAIVMIVSCVPDTAQPVVAVNSL